MSTMFSTPSRRNCFQVVAHDDGEHFTVHLLTDRRYVGTPEVTPERLARWKRKVSRRVAFTPDADALRTARGQAGRGTGGTGRLHTLCEKVAQAAAIDAVDEVWSYVLVPQIDPAVIPDALN